jgi:hypothetical protein
MPAQGGGMLQLVAAPGGGLSSRSMCIRSQLSGSIGRSPCHHMRLYDCREMTCSVGFRVAGNLPPVHGQAPEVLPRVPACILFFCTTTDAKLFQSTMSTTWQVQQTQCTWPQQEVGPGSHGT